MKRKLLFIKLIILFTCSLNAQVTVDLYEQFNGRYDFTFVGNTLNADANGPLLDANGNPVTDPDTGLPIYPPCTLLSSSSSDLNLAAGDQIHKAYLYWAASGTGDFEVTLNNQTINADTGHIYPFQFVRVENINGVPTTVVRDFFSAFADVTSLVQSTGNGTYTFSDLDISAFVNGEGNTNLYCRNGTNFGGWAIIVIYENPALPLNQINLYDGLEGVPEEINITLNSINVIDNIGAKIGFIAWEGDENLDSGEVLRINGTALGNTLNPPTNAFNGTNSVTGQTGMHNMDLDIYSIQNYINPGDVTAQIKLRSTADFVMINAVVTVLNSELPDATIIAENLISACNSRTFTVDYTVGNYNSTDPLPAGTPIAIYADGVLVGTTQTINELPIDGSDNGTITLTIPATVPLDFELLFVVDDQGDGTGGIVQETDETNNTFVLNVSLPASSPLQDPADLTACDTGNGTGVFDFSAYETSLQNSPTDIITFHLTEADAESGINDITNLSSFPSTANPQEIFVRLENTEGCYTVGSFMLIAIDCELPDATIVLGETERTCNSRTITVNFTVNNFNSQDILPAGTPIAIYANGIFIEYTETLLPIPIGGSENGTISVTIPDDIPLDFELTFVVDDIGDGTGIVPEIDEDNNTSTIGFSLIISPVLQQPADIIACDQGLGIGTFDFSSYEQQLQNNAGDIVTFYTTLENAQQDIDPIFNTSQFLSTANPQQIFVRLFDGNCFTTGSFFLRTKKCPPVTYNYVTPNGDGKNDSFFVEGLRNIFLNFKMSIYNRWGNLVWEGDHSKNDWNGVASVNKVGPEGNNVPVGTYYFVLELNDPDYPEPIVGWVYVTE